MTVPKNNGKTVITFTFDVSATGTTTVTAPAIRLSEGDVLPGPPTVASASAGDASATVSFVRPATAGRSAITRYTVTATDTTTPAHGGQTQSGTASPITVRGLTSGDNYTFTVAATNASGTGPPSAESESVTPSVPLAAGVLTDSSDGFGTCAVISDGERGLLGSRCLGQRDHGQLRHRTAGARHLHCHLDHQRQSGRRRLLRIALGRERRLLGDNTDGELGNGTTGGPDCNGSCYDTPQAVTGITTAISVTSVSSVDLAAGYCAVLSTGGVDCWGDNTDGSWATGPPAVPMQGSCYDTPQAVTGITNAASAHQ